jgi:hypothetical protein
MPDEVRERKKISDKVVHLYSQAERARKLASVCGSQLVADLLEDHARLCERNAEKRRAPQKVPS